MYKVVGVCRLRLPLLSHPLHLLHRLLLLHRLPLLHPLPLLLLLPLETAARFLVPFKVARVCARPSRTIAVVS